jgi:NDP-sugar pyrophosphorylase family protein
LASSGTINGGIYLIDRAIIDSTWPAVFSLEKDFFPNYLQKGVYGFFAKGPLIDIGTPDSFAQAQKMRFS